MSNPELYNYILYGMGQGTGDMISQAPLGPASKFAGGVAKTGVGALTFLPYLAGSEASAFDPGGTAPYEDPRSKGDLAYRMVKPIGDTARGMGDLAQRVFINRDPEAMGEAAGMLAMPHLFKMPELPRSVGEIPDYLRSPVEFRYGKGAPASSPPGRGQVNRSPSRGASAKAGASSVSGGADDATFTIGGIPVRHEPVNGGRSGTGGDVTLSFGGVPIPQEPINSGASAGATDKLYDLGTLMRDANLKTRQPNVSRDLVSQYVDMLLSAPADSPSEAPPVKEDNGVIVDGNHRYIADTIARKLGYDGPPLQTVPGVTPNNAGPVLPWNSVNWY